MRLSFHGAAGTVTGSKYLLEVNNHKLLIDCGMFQGARELRQRNRNPLPFDASGVDAVVLTHAHIDHIGLLPKLVRDGFSGTVYATLPTKDIAEVTLMDSAYIQEEDAEYRNKKKLSRHKVALPLFTSEDAQTAIDLFQGLEFGQWQQAGEEFRFRYHVAGHILGAASVEVEFREGERTSSILFSGDVGRYGNPLTTDPAVPPSCDYLVCESTYGGRIHPPIDAYFEFANLINRIVESKQVLLIPAFAIGRTQQITYLLSRLVETGQVPPIDIHVDSPMAISATDIYCKYPSYHAIDISTLKGKKCALATGHVKLHRKRKSSKVLNKLKGPAIIISASGMLTAGRILHHLLNRLDDPGTVVALVGFMAKGTLGRKLQNGDKTVFIHKQPVEVKASVVTLGGLSGHADYYELLHWLEPLNGQPKRVFITHGEISQSEAMAHHLRREKGWPSLIPSMDQTVEL
jgi:metallo-beta-lactamase family protein